MKGMHAVYQRLLRLRQDPLAGQKVGLKTEKVCGATKRQQLMTLIVSKMAADTEYTECSRTECNERLGAGVEVFLRCNRWPPLAGPSTPEKKTPAKKRRVIEMSDDSEDGEPSDGE